MGDKLKKFRKEPRYIHLRSEGLRTMSHERVSDPIREQLVANCDAPRDSAAWERAEDALRDYDEARARGEPRCGTCGGPMFQSVGGLFCPVCSPFQRYLVGEQTVREDIGNALAAASYTLAAAVGRGKDGNIATEYKVALQSVVRLLRHALTQLETPK